MRDAGRGRTHGGARGREPARAARVRRDIRAHAAPAAQARGRRRARAYVTSDLLMGLRLCLAMD